MTKTPLRRSVHWWTWSEYCALHPELSEVFEEWKAAGWGPVGRLSLAAFVDGSHQLEVPMRRKLNGATVNITRRFHIPAERAAG